MIPPPLEQNADGAGELRVELDAFTLEALRQEATRMAVSVEEFVRFAALYYLADLDSGRIARHHPTPPPATQRRDPLGRIFE
jgi:hypothetical protein